MCPSDSEPISQLSIPVRGQAVQSSVVAAGSARLWIITLMAGVLAGLAAWIGGEVSGDRIKPPRHAVNSKGLVLNVTGRREVALSDARNAGVAFALLGGGLGVGLGVAGGLIRRSRRAAGEAALAGLILGAVATALSSLVLLPLYNSYQARNPDEAARDLIFPLLVHAGVWSAAGAAAGIAYGIGLGQRRSLARIALGGLAGAVIGTVAYELIGVVLFPAAQTTRFVSITAETRLLARLAVTVLAAAGVAFAVSEPRQS